MENAAMLIDTEDDQERLGLDGKYLDQYFYDAEYGEARVLTKIEWNDDRFQAATDKADTNTPYRRSSPFDSCETFLHVIHRSLGSYIAG